MDIQRLKQISEAKIKTGILTKEVRDTLKEYRHNKQDLQQGLSETLQKKRRTYRQFYYDGKVTSVCKICLYSRDPKTVNLIYSGKPVRLEERGICDTNVFVITNFFWLFSGYIMEAFLFMKMERMLYMHVME